MRFSKYHGLGNDFVVVDLRATDAATTAAIQEPAVVQAVCDRQFGIGAIFSAPLVADGVVYVGSADGYLYAIE